MIIKFDKVWMIITPKQSEMIFEMFDYNLELSIFFSRYIAETKSVENFFTTPNTSCPILLCYDDTIHDCWYLNTEFKEMIK